MYLLERTVAISQQDAHGPVGTASVVLNGRLAAIGYDHVQVSIVVDIACHRDYGPHAVRCSSAARIVASSNPQCAIAVAQQNRCKLRIRIIDRSVCVPHHDVALSVTVEITRGDGNRNAGADAGGRCILKSPISVSEKDGHGPLRTGTRVALGCYSDVEFHVTIEISGDNPNRRRTSKRIGHRRLKRAISSA